MGLYKKEDYDYMARKRLSAFRQIAKELGKENTITKMMGSLAWGRHDAEQGVGGNLHTAIREMSFLDGYFKCLNIWARDNDREAQIMMLNIYPLRYETKK